MLSIEVELLGGRYAATAYNDRERAEWPPHPARFFSALVAALHDQSPDDPQERAALEWLETLPPPALDVDLDVNETLGRRDVREVYVPVNDVTIVGDPEKPVREAQSKRAALEAEPKGKERDAELKKTQKDIEKAAHKLGAFMADLQVPDAEPSLKSVKTARALLPEGRTRQVRTFPVVVPSCSTLVFCWFTVSAAPHRAALDRLCERVTRLGHSSSLVRCRVVDRLVTPNLVPDLDGSQVLRVVGPGQLQRLEKEFSRHQAVESRVLPARPQRYRRVEDASESDGISVSMFSADWVIFERVGGARPLSSCGLDFAQALRRALIEQHGTETLPPCLSGHAADGGPTNEAHIAFLSLPFVGHEHADGLLQGCAVVLPRGIAPSERGQLMALLAAWEETRAIDDLGTLELSARGGPSMRVRRVEVPSKKTLQPGRWCRAASRFVSVTPIALDRNPGNLRSHVESTVRKAFLEAQGSIADACERIGLPRPRSVEVSFTPLVQGAQSASAFRARTSRAGGHPRVRVHADIHFDQRVEGPLLLGAGRYFGLGLCLPVNEVTL